MAKLVPWEVAHRGDLVVDTCILLEEFERDTRTLGGRSLLAAIHPKKRFTAVTCLFEFLQPSDPLSEPRFRARESWLEDSRVRVSPWVDAHEPLERLARQRAGAPRLADAHVAAACIGLGRPLLTRNVRDFERIVDLRLVELPW